MMIVPKGLKRKALRLSILIAAIYLVVSLCWILGSDYLGLRITNTLEEYQQFQNSKGIIFVSVMAIIIAVLTYRLYLSQETEIRARTLATTDLLTQLANQQSFMEALHTQLQYAQAPFGVIVVDALQFRRINSSLGRERGDLLLYRMGRRVLEHAGPKCVVARMEADKFAVITPGFADESRIEGLATAMLDALNLEYPAGDHSIRLDVFGGYAVANPSEQPISVAELLGAADTALETAKRQRVRRLARFDPELHRDAGEQFRMELELRKALKDRDLDVHFQPQVRLDNGRIRGAEVLVRWNHRDQGMISPAVFIPVAEETGLIDDVGAFVIDRAFQWLAESESAEKEGLLIGINAAGHQLDSGELPALLREASARWNQPLDRFEIEVTESMALQNPEDSIRYLHELRDLGVSIALDDFGTGMSSLQYLLDLPVDVLKIDRSFIAGLPDNRRQAKFVRTIIDLARDLNMEVVAEGVETDGQRQMLAGMGCHIAQGYLLARPMPATDLENWLAENSGKE